MEKLGTISKIQDLGIGGRVYFGIVSKAEERVLR
jgi:hypothetical protein